MRFNSVSRSFNGALAAVFVLLVAVSLAAAGGLLAVERHLEVIEQAWPSETAPLPASMAGAPAADGLAVERRAAAGLISRASGAVHAEVAAGRHAEMITLAGLAASVGIAALIAAGLAARVDRKTLRPLAVVTREMSRFAGDHLGMPLAAAAGRDDVGTIAAALQAFRAKAAALVEAERRMETLATHDHLTGLPNRKSFTGQVDAAMRRRGADATCAMMLIDLDHFRPVNDLYGHAAGDVLMQVIAARLRPVAGQDGILARLNGDSFAIGMAARHSHRSAMRDAIALATHAIAAIAETVEIDGARIAVGASIGIALHPLDGAKAAEEMLRAADLAMQRAKGDGRGTFRFYKNSMDQDLRARIALEADVRAALRDDAIEPFYQPIVDLATDRIAGFEVLARWRHAERGAVPPDTFIPVVERLGLLDQMTAAILHRACRDARAWEPDVTVAVNVSPAQFQNIGFAAHLALTLRAERFDPRRLEVEVTETALVGDLQAARHTMQALQRLGVALVLDDFGSGCANLSHLREFRFDKIKIDSSFIRAMAHSKPSRTIVDAMLDLARNLGMPMIAEGVDTVENRHLLASRGCAFGQGFWFSQAVPADLATAMLKRHNGGILRATG